MQADDGYWHTGDVGEWRNGALRLVDRARDFLVTAGGKTISPSMIENGLRASPYIAEAVVFGHGRKYLTALIEIDFDTVADWARSRDVDLYRLHQPRAERGGAATDPQRRSTRRMTQFARVEQIKAFRILPKALDPEEEGEPVTPTRKVKRALMYERFKPLVEAMYDDSESRLLAGEVRRRLACVSANLNTRSKKNQGGSSCVHQSSSPRLWPRRLRAGHGTGCLCDRHHRGADRPAGQTYAPAMEALRIYIDRVNARGGINGKKVNLVIQDDSAEPSKAAANVKKLLTQDNAVLLVNASLSSTYAPVVAESRNAGVPLLFASAVCPKEVYPPADPLQFCTTGFCVDLSTAAPRSPSSRRPRRSR